MNIGRSAALASSAALTCHALKPSSRANSTIRIASCTPGPSTTTSPPNENLLSPPTIHTPKSAASKHMARSDHRQRITQLHTRPRAPETPNSSPAEKTTIAGICPGYLLNSSRVPLAASFPAAIPSRPPSPPPQRLRDDTWRVELPPPPPSDPAPGGVIADPPDGRSFTS